MRFYLQLILGVCALVAAMPQVSACVNAITLPRVSMSRYLLPTVADRMDHWDNQYELTEDDALFFLLPNDAKVNIQSDQDAPAIERIKEGDERLSGKVSRMQLSQPGYTWWSLLAVGQGSSSINIITGAQKKILTVNVKAYVPRMEFVPAKPYTITTGEATRERPLYISFGSYVEITLPGEMKGGWSVNDAGEGGLELKRAEQLPASAGAAHPQVKLTFFAPNNSDRREPYHLVIKRGGGLFGGESFGFYVVIHPAAKC